MACTGSKLGLLCGQQQWLSSHAVCAFFRECVSGCNVGTDCVPRPCWLAYRYILEWMAWQPSFRAALLGSCLFWRQPSCIREPLVLCVFRVNPHHRVPPSVFRQLRTGAHSHTSIQALGSAFLQRFCVQSVCVCVWMYCSLCLYYQLPVCFPVSLLVRLCCSGACVCAKNWICVYTC